MIVTRLNGTLAMLLACSTIAACGGGGTGDSVVTPPTGVEPTTPTPPASSTPTTLSLNNTSLQMSRVGETQQLTAEVRDQNGAVISGAPLNWSVSPSSVATVSTTGLVTAVSTGVATLRVTSGVLAASASINVQIATTPTACTTRPVFTNYLIDPALLKVVTQIGVVGGGNTEIVGRSYVMPIDGMDGIKMALTAPADLKITAARHYLPPGAPTVGYVPDWSLVFDAGCGVTVELFHVKDVAASIKAVVDTTIYPSSAWQPLTTPVSFRAGETFGWYERGLNSVAFDVIAHDKNTRNHWANQQRYEVGGSNILDVVCPWSLFELSKRDAYLNAIGAPTGFRVPGAGCGSVERDVVGTTAGQWFTSATLAPFSLTKTGNYGNPLPIILGVDSTVYVGHTGPANDVRIARNNATWKDPATISSSWCYQIENGSTKNGWLWLRLNNATQMDVSYSDSGLCPTTFPSEFMAYYR